MVEIIDLRKEKNKKIKEQSQLLNIISEELKNNKIDHRKIFDPDGNWAFISIYNEPTYIVMVHEKCVKLKNIKTKDIEIKNKLFEIGKKAIEKDETLKKTQIKYIIE